MAEDILSVVKDKVRLNQESETVFKANEDDCPFHIPARCDFTVDTRKDMYYCFACGAGGPADKFLEAVKEEEKRYA